MNALIEKIADKLKVIRYEQASWDDNAREIIEMVRADSEPLGAPIDPRFRPTRRDLVHLRMDAEAAGRDSFPVKVILAPAVLYMSWPNSRHNPSDEDSTPYHCISFHIPKPE